MEENDSTDCEAAEETEPTDVGEVLQKAGLDRSFWSKVLKDELGVDRSEQLQYLSVSDYEVIKRHERYKWEKKALQKVLGIQQPASKRQEQEKIEQVKRNLADLRKIHLEGKDCNDAKVKIKIDESSALEVPKGSWLESGKPLQDLIKPLFDGLSSIEEGLNSPAETIPDEEVLRSASGGLALQGIYQTGSLEDLLQKRQQLLKVPESFVLLGPEQKCCYEKKEFNSWESQAKFQKVIERLGVSFSVSCKIPSLGIESEVKNENELSKEETKKSTAENTSIIATQYNYIPMASCLIEKDKLMLCDSALNELQKLETLRLNVNEKKNPDLLKEVDRFFQTFGSHVNQGPLHFGGIFWWTASAEGVSSSDLSEVKSLTSTALSAYVGIGSFFGGSGGMSTSLSHCQGSFEGKYSARLLSKVQLSVSKSGGPPETYDHLKWKSGLVTSNKSWCVIDRGENLVPIWEIIQSSHSQNFKDVSKLSNFMMKAYKKITKQEAGSMWGQNVCSAMKEAQTVIQSVKMWSVSNSEKHLGKLLNIKRNLEDMGATKAWVQECLSNRDLQDFLTSVTIQNTDLSLRAMMKLLMDQSCDVKDFPNRDKILKWTKLPKEDLPKVTSASEFSDLEKILSDIKDNFCNLQEPGMSPEEVATYKITAAINSLLPRLRNKNETNIELLILSIVNVLGYREGTFRPPLGLEEIVFLQETLHQRYEDYTSLKERSSEKAEAFLLLKALTVSRDNQRIPPEDKKARLKFLASRTGDICLVSKLINDSENHKDWNKLEEELNKIINETSQTKEQEGLQIKIQELDQYMKPSKQNIHPTQEHTSSRTGTEPCPIDEWKAGRVRGLLQRLGLWELYPTKIKMQEVLLITNMSRIEGKTDEKSLYHQYIYKLMMLDCSARNLSLNAIESAEPQSFSAEDAVSCYENDASDSDDEYFIAREDTTSPEVSENDSSVHPMDIHMAVFHCSDDFVRQYLFSKLSTCQFALPLLVPNHLTGEIIFPAWAYRQIKKTWQNKQQLIFNADVPIVSFVRLGQSSNSKSNILSNIISQEKYPVFFNRHCTGSMRHCLLMDGVVEITWYCAGSNEGDNFEDCVVFVNLHGDASDHPRQLQFLQEVSTATVLLLSESPLQEEASKTFKQLRVSSTPLITLLSNAEKIQGKSKRNIKIAAKNRNEAELTSEIISSIKHCLSLKPERRSLAACLDIARQNQFRIDEDTDQCREAKAQAQHLVNLLRGGESKDRNEEELTDFKGKHLPLQGGLWESWCRKDKQQYHLHSTGNRSIEMIKSDIISEKKAIRIKQLNKALPLSGFMRPFVQYLNGSKNKVLYMLQWLQIFMEEYTTGQHVSLQEKYHSIWIEMRAIGQDNELEKELEKLCEEMNKMSVGLQHLMRELSQLYEAVKSVAESEDFTGIQCLDTLPRIGAEMLMAGYPLELMDGDVAHVALDWIKAVFDKLIKKLGDKKVFVLSVLGLQSSGKSTLLNTMFGLQFPVSAGRCTRGAFMQLLTVDEEMRKQLQFDFVLVVDTEGLRSLERSSEADLAYDNELATFIIGIGNMTLINIMGENPCEMQDILQICVQAFMRMTSVKIKTSCIFVHQNVAETTAKENNMEGRRHMLKRLDEMACIAAKEEKQDIKCFSDIIHFDVESQVFYFKNLLKGDPPMAPPNPSYSQNVQKLKGKLLSITKWLPDCRLPSLSEVKKRIQDVWDALLRENFVFSFRNTLEISAYSKLEKSYGQWSWSLRRHALEIQQTWCNKINSNLVDDVHLSDIMKEFDEIYTQLKGKIETYFANEDHPEILVNWKCNVDTRFNTLKDQLIEDTQRKCRDVLNIRKCRSNLDQKRIGYEAELLRSSKALAFRLQDEKLTSDEMRSHFDEMWIKWSTKISSEIHPEKQIYIQALTEAILHDHFKHEKDIAQKIQEITHFEFKVDKHVSLSYRQWFSEKLSRVHITEGSKKTEKEGKRLTKEILSNVQKYINKISRQKGDFNEIFIHEILEIITQMVTNYEESESHIKLLNDYKVDLSIYLCKKEAENFHTMHTDFKRKNDPLTCLNERKDEYFQYFKDSCDGAASILIFARYLCNYLKSAIKQQIYSKVSLQIVDKMKNDCPAFNGGRTNLEDHILKELAETKKFKLYLRYLSDPKKHFESFIRRKVEKYCENQSLTSDLLRRNLTYFIETTLTESSMVTCELKKNGTISEWLDNFCSKIGSILPISKDNFKNIECEDTGNLSFLQDMITESLSDMQADATQEIRTLCLDLNMFENRPDDILIEQLSGCWEQCPFCKAVCTNTIPGHDSDHSVKFHRPAALAGTSYSSDQQFSIEFCTTLVAADTSFQNHKEEWIPFKEYRKAGPPFDRWSIKPETSEKVYWKWFVCTFRGALQEKFGHEFEGKGKIPKSWEDIDESRAIEELDCGTKTSMASEF